MRRLFGRVIGNNPGTGKFMSQEQSQLQAVQASLADIDGTIADAEKALRGLALDAVLNPDGEAANQAAAAVVRLDGLKQRRRLLQEALTVAEENEQSRLDERSERDRKARARAFAQHLAAYERAVSTVAGIQSELQAAFSRAMAAANAAGALLPYHMRYAIDLLSDSYLRQLMDVEAERIGRGEVASLSDPAKPPMRLREFEHPRTGAIPSLAELVGQHVANIKRAYDPRSFTPKPKPSSIVAPLGDGEPAGAVISGAAAPAGDFPVREASAPPAAVSSPPAPAAAPHDPPPGVMPGGVRTSYFARVGGAPAMAVGEPVADLATAIPPPPEQPSPAPAPAAAPAI